MITFDDVYDIKKNGALVIGRNRLDDYATKFLSKYCKEALERPMPLPVTDILKKMGLHVLERSLSKNLDIFGCCTMFACDIEVFDEDGVHKEHFQEGNIIIDPKSEALFGEGQKRNTLLHEMIHWEKDKVYFDILRLKNNFNEDFIYSITPIMCRQSQIYFEPNEKSKTKENEIRWLEWQANKLAPRILMPKGMFKKKAEELMNDKSIQSCEELIKKLSMFFIVSKLSVKLRLLEVGLEEKINQYDDFDLIYDDDCVEAYSKLSVVEAYKLIENSSSLRQWIHANNFLFVEGYFVLPFKGYIRNDDGILKLTKKAKANLKKCVLNIRKIQYNEFYEEEIACGILYRGECSTKTFYMFSPEFQNLQVKELEEAYQAAADTIFVDDVEEEKELVKILTDPDKTLCEVITFMMEKKNWNSPTKFNHKTLLNNDYYSRIKRNGMNNMEKETLMAICVGLGLKSYLVQRLFDEKSVKKLDRYKEPDRSYIKILDCFPLGLTIDDFNILLEKNKLQPLGSIIR